MEFKCVTRERQGSNAKRQKGSDPINDGRHGRISSCRVSIGAPVGLVANRKGESGGFIARGSDGKCGITLRSSQPCRKGDAGFESSERWNGWGRLRTTIPTWDSSPRRRQFGSQCGFLSNHRLFHVNIAWNPPNGWIADAFWISGSASQHRPTRAL